MKNKTHRRKIKAPNAANLASGQTSFLDLVQWHPVQERTTTDTDFAMCAQTSRNMLEDGVRDRKSFEDCTDDGSVEADADIISKKDSATY